MKLDFSWLYGAEFRELLYQYRQTGEGYQNIREFVKMKVEYMFDLQKDANRLSSYDI